MMARKAAISNLHSLNGIRTYGINLTVQDLALKESMVAVNIFQEVQMTVWSALLVLIVGSPPCERQAS